MRKICQRFLDIVIYICPSPNNAILVIPNPIDPLCGLERGILLLQSTKKIPAQGGDDIFILFI